MAKNARDIMLGNVGLLRGQLSRFMTSITEFRLACRASRMPSPEGLTLLMSLAQGAFVELLRASDILVTTRENLKRLQPGEEVLRPYLEDWGYSQALEKLEFVRAFYNELPAGPFDGFSYAPDFVETGLFLIDCAEGKIKTE